MCSNRRGFLLSVLACGATMGLHASTQLKKKPNILMIYTDDQTYDSIRALGNMEIRTPNIDRLVKRGTSFTQCYNPGGWHGALCVASRTMMNTGLFLWQARSLEGHSKRYDPLITAHSMLSQRMQDAGYWTALTGKWHVSGCKPQRVFDKVANERPGMPGTVPQAYNRPGEEGTTDSWKPWDRKRGGFWAGGTHWTQVTADDTIGFINEACRNDKPFFIYSAFNAPHDPRQAPEEFVKAYPPEKIAIPPNFLPEHPLKSEIGSPASMRDERLAPYPRTHHAVQVHRAEYYALITHLDQHIGRIFDTLEYQNLVENTYVVLCSDNGLAVGQHGLIGKQSLYEHSMRVPLIVAGPTIPKDKRIDAPVYLQDIRATMLEWAGAKPQEGIFKSLMPLIRGEVKEQREATYGAYMPRHHRSFRVGDMKLIWSPLAPKEEQRFELYDIKNDRHEITNLINEPTQTQTIESLKKGLWSYMGKVKDPLISECFPNQLRLKKLINPRIEK